MKRSIFVVLCFFSLLAVALIADNPRKESDKPMQNSVTFEYLPGKKISGTVAEIFPDGTLLVRPDKIPEEWRVKNREQSAPSYFHVDPRAFLLSDSDMGKKYRAYEKEITSLPSTEWRNPPGKLSAKGCEFYYEALKKLDAKSLGNKDGSSIQITYFGHSSLWATARLRDHGFSNIVDRCDKAWTISEDGDTLLFVLSKASEPQKRKRNMIVRATRGGGGKILYILPGNHIMLEKHPTNPDLLFASVDGWPDRKSGNPDPRWQSVYLFDVHNPDNYKIVRYPLPASSYAPVGDERLYGHSGFFSKDGRFFYALLYGFEEEGGGLWVADISEEDFCQNASSFAQIFSWDHALSFFFLPKTEHSPYNVVLMTGKEVNDDFAMTLNALTIRFDGLQSELIEKKRLITMVGWNPVPFAYKRISDDEILIYIETYFNFESEIVPRVKNVYIVPIK